MLSVFRDHARTLAKLLLTGALITVAAYIGRQTIVGHQLDIIDTAIAAVFGALLAFIVLFVRANLSAGEEDDWHDDTRK